VEYPSFGPGVTGNLSDLSAASAAL